MFASEYDHLVDEVNDLHILSVDNEAAPNSDEHVGTFQQLEVVLKVMQLEGHLTASPVYQNEVAVVPVSLHIDNLIDTTAAGDYFAAGYLWSYTQYKDIQTSLQTGTILASHIIQEVGAQLSPQTWDKILKVFF